MDLESMDVADFGKIIFVSRNHTIPGLPDMNLVVFRAVGDIIDTAFSQGDLKRQLFARYLGAKHQYLVEKIARENKAKSRKEEFFNAWRRVFQVQPIQFNLTLAAGVA